MYSVILNKGILAYSKYSLEFIYNECIAKYFLFKKMFLRNFYQSIRWLGMYVHFETSIIYPVL